MNFNNMQIGDLSFSVPIIQGGMGIGVSGSSLAGTVSRCGGLGVISAAQIGYKEPDFNTNPLAANIRALKKSIHDAKDIAQSKPIGVNIMVAMNYYKELVTAAIESGADVIISGAGIPSELPKYAIGSHTKLIPIVSSLKAARVIQKHWLRNYNKTPDAIIVEGPLAGGHLGFKLNALKDGTTQKLEDIISDILRYFKENKIKIPVIAAGGIFDGKDIAQFLSLGTSGVQMATRFVTTHECDASDSYKNAYINAKKEDIRIIQSPVGMPGRALYNSFIKKSEEVGTITPSRCHQCLMKCNKKDILFCINDALKNAVEGNIDNGLIFVGENAYRCHKMISVEEIINQLIGELNRT